MAATANQALRRRGSNEDLPPNLNEDRPRRSSTTGMFRRHERERREAAQWDDGRIAIILLMIFVISLTFAAGFDMFTSSRQEKERQILGIHDRECKWLTHGDKAVLSSKQSIMAITDVEGLESFIIAEKRSTKVKVLPNVAKDDTFVLTHQFWSSKSASAVWKVQSSAASAKDYPLFQTVFEVQGEEPRFLSTAQHFSTRAFHLFPLSASRQRRADTSFAGNFLSDQRAVTR